MSRKLAITFSGAVSLGSYEAGVLYEVLNAIGQHNLQPGVHDDDKIFVDVLTGASAGGLSVALAAQKLLYEGKSLEEPYDNPLFHSWVTEIDLDGLLTFEEDEPSDCSILSSNRIETIAKKFLLTRYENGAAPLIDPHPAIGPERQLRLGLALSNLNGVDYSQPTLSGSNSADAGFAKPGFVYTRFQDEFTVKLDANTDSEAVWEAIEQAAVSCGAFPFAFRAQELSRERDSYPNLGTDSEFWGTKPTRAFTYTDGGLFQNQPLGLAKNLVDEIDHHQNSDCRAYLYVSPNPKISTADTEFSAKTANFKNITGRLVSAILNQARFQDWVEAETVNEQVGLFNKRAEQLFTLVQNHTLPIPAMQSISTPLLDGLFGSDQDKIKAAREQLKGQFKTDYDTLVQDSALGSVAADAWIDSILVFETAADLHLKDEMYIYTATAQDSELAGSGLMAFLGFFDEDYRRHDYNVGRLKAREFLSHDRKQEHSPLPDIQYVIKPIEPPIDHNLTNLPISSAPLEKRKRLRDRLKNRANILLKEANLPVIFREPLELFYLDRKIDEFLGL